jgi:hypothetical protein
MSKLKGRLLLGLGCAVVLILGAALFYYVRGRLSSMPAMANVFRLEAGPSRGIYGSYLFVRESSGTGPARGAQIVLKFIPPNVVALRATRPGETLTDLGAFTLDGQKISLTLPELGKSVSRGNYRYDGNQLVLPLLIINEGEGSSTWKRINTGADPLNAAIEGFYANVGKQGRAACLRNMAQQLQREPAVQSAKIYDEKLLLVTYRTGYREFFLAPAVSNAPVVQAAQEPETETPGTDAGLSSLGPITPLRSRLLPVQFLPGGMPPAVNPAGPFEAWLAREPEPISHGDAPPEKTALILAPFHTLPVLIPDGKGLHYKTFADGGEDLDYIKQQLENAGYPVEGPYIDAQVNVKRLYDSLKNKSWGVFYFSTHGGVLEDEDDAVLSTGEQVPMEFSVTPEKREQYLKGYFEKYLQQSVGNSLGKEAYEELDGSLMVGFMYDDIPFVAIKSGFFRAVGANFSSSLVYLSGCETAKSSHFRDVMHARSFAGWKMETDMDVAADMSKAFWRCLSRKTRSDREAMDFGIIYLLGAKNYGAKVSAYGPTWNPRNFVVYRQGRTEPEKPLTPIQRTMLLTAREFAFRQSHVSGAQEDLPGLVAQLYKCNAEGNKLGLGANLYCVQAFNGVTVADSEIDEVKGELCGYGDKPRFTLIEK